MTVAYNRVVARPGFPPPSCLAYRRAALRWFIPGGGNAGVRRVLLECLPNRDWTNHQEIEVYTGVGAVDETALKVRVAKGLTEALAHRAFRLYRRNRWTGQEEALSDLAIIEVCCGLLQLAYTMWADRRGRKRRRVGQEAVVQEGGVGVSGHATNEGADIAEGDESAAEEQGGIGLDAMVVEGQDAGPTFAEQNEAHRRSALEWLALRRPSPHSHLVLLRTVIAPLQSMLRSFLTMSSDNWEVCQRARLVREEASDGVGRDFRILVAARGDLEKVAIQKITSLMRDPVLWCLLLPADVTVRLRASAYIMLSRCAAGLTRRFVYPHAKPPFSVFFWRLSIRDMPATLRGNHCACSTGGASTFAWTIGASPARMHSTSSRWPLSLRIPPQSA